MTVCVWVKERERGKKQRQTNSSKWLCVEAIMLKWKQSRYLLKWKEAIFGLWSQKERKKTAPQACYLIWMTLWWDITQSVSPSFCPLSASWSTHWLSLHSFSVFLLYFLSVELSFNPRGKRATTLKEKCCKVGFCALCPGRADNPYNDCLWVCSKNYQYYGTI